MDSVDLGIRQVPKAEFLAGSLHKSGLLHTDRFEQFLLGGEKFRRIKSSKCLPGTYGLAGELDVKPFNTSADISCLRLQTTFVRNNLTVQPDLLHGVTAADTGSLNIGESHGLIREPDGIGIGNSITSRNNVLLKRDQVHTADRAFAGFVLTNLRMHGAGPDTGFVLHQIMRRSMHIMVMSFSMCFPGRLRRR